MAANKNDKQAKREATRKKHSASPILKREAPSQEIHKNILIVGEGVHTEPSYFEQFKEPGVKIVAIGLGEGTRKLVNDVENHKAVEERKLNGKTFDEVWVVFDKDSFKDFNQAISEAKSKGYNVAYSNQAIEYWFILHFMDHQGGAMDRKDYAKVLNALLEKLDPKNPIKYDPESKTISEEIFNVLYKNIQFAYDRADRIYQYKLSQGMPTEESVTTIHELVHSIKGITTSTQQVAQKKKLESMQKAGLIL